MKLYINKALIAILIFSSLTSCIRLDFDENNPPIPTEPKVNLTVDWSKRGAGVDIPSEYKVLINNEELTYKQATNQLPKYAKGTYPTVIYNQVTDMTVENGKVVLKENNGEIASKTNWFFTATTAIGYTDKAENYKVEMIQQIRQLNINVTFKGNGTQSVTALQAKLEGVANKLQLNDNALSGENLFIKPSLAKNGNKFSSVNQLLGFTSEAQILDLTLSLSGGSTKNIQTDLSDKLKDFNKDKLSSMTIDIEYDLSTNSYTIKTSISDWNFH